LYIDLYSPAIEWQARLPIARGLGSGQHVLRLTVSDASSGGTPSVCTVDAFEVSAGLPPPFPTLPVAGLGLGLLAVAGLIVLDQRRRPRREKFF
jgi:hypothetical protein